MDPSKHEELVALIDQSVTIRYRTLLTASKVGVVRAVVADVGEKYLYLYDADTGDTKVLLEDVIAVEWKEHTQPKQRSLEL